MPEILGMNFIDINFITALQVVRLGLLGGVLSGFIGSGGVSIPLPDLFYAPKQRCCLGLRSSYSASTKMMLEKE